MFHNLFPYKDKNIIIKRQYGLYLRTENGCYIKKFLKLTDLLQIATLPKVQIKLICSLQAF